jgi:hypothetical protein
MASSPTNHAAYHKAMCDAGRTAATLAAHAFEATSGSSTLSQTANVRHLQELANTINETLAIARMEAVRIRDAHAAAECRNATRHHAVMRRMTDDLPIRISRAPSPANTARWHTIAQASDDTTQAMDTPTGVIIRTMVEGQIGPVVGMVAVEGVCVAKRWSVILIDADPDDGTAAGILVYPEIALRARARMPSTEASPMLYSEFRWYHADDPMPDPTEDQIREAVTRKTKT